VTQSTSSISSVSGVSFAEGARAPLWDRVRSVVGFGAIARLVREAWDEVRSLDLGLTRDHVRTLTRMGVALAGLSVLVLLTIGVRVANDRLELSNRRSAQQMKLLQKEGDRLALELQARRGAPQMEAVIRQLGLAAAPELEVGADGTVQRARMAPTLRVQPIIAPDAAPATGETSSTATSAPAPEPASTATPSASAAIAPKPAPASKTSESASVVRAPAAQVATSKPSPVVKPAPKVEAKPSAGKSSPSLVATSPERGPAPAARIVAPSTAVRAATASDARRTP
jgi:hypothetical protein